MSLPPPNSLKERRRAVLVLLCGTSGSGKSTLASILVGSLRAAPSQRRSSAKAASH